MIQMTKNYNGDIEWNIGTLFAHDKFVIDLYDVSKDMGLDFPITSVFGSTPCKFQGGRIPPYEMDKESCLDIVNKHLSRGIGIKLTYSNYFITEDDIKRESDSIDLIGYLNDKGNHNCGVIVSNDLFAKFLKKNFKNLEIIASQVKPSIEVGLGKDSYDYYNRLFEIYDTVVVNPFKINDFNFLEKLENHNRVEFIVNHRCSPNCPSAGHHYITQMKYCDKRSSGEDYSKEEEELKRICDGCCTNRRKYPFSGNQMSDNEIEMLIQMGFKKFKLEGRDNDGIVMIRDMGDYIYNHNLFNRVSGAIMSVTV